MKTRYLFISALVISLGLTLFFCVTPGTGGDSTTTTSGGGDGSTTTNSSPTTAGGSPTTTNYTAPTTVTVSTLQCSPQVIYDDVHSGQVAGIDNAAPNAENITYNFRSGTSCIKYSSQDGNDANDYADSIYYFNSGQSAIDFSMKTNFSFWIKADSGATTFSVEIALKTASTTSAFYDLGTIGTTYVQKSIAISNFTGITLSQVNGFVFRAHAGDYNYQTWFIDDISVDGCSVVYFTQTSTTVVTTNTLPTTTLNMDSYFPYNDNTNSYPYSQTFLSEDNATVTARWSSYKSQFIVDCAGGACDSGDTRCRVKFNSTQTVSEGIGYGMLLSAYMNDQVVFDRLWAYAKDFLDKAGTIGGCVGACSGLMHWKIDGCSAIAGGGQNAATDGDEDMILGLYMAHKVWGSGGSVNYLSDAQTQAYQLLAFTIESAGWVKNGDEWGGCAAGSMNPSYFAPAWYEVFNVVYPHSRWNDAISKTYYLIVDQQISVYNYKLPSNWCTCTGQIGGAGGTPAGEYGYEACRATWRISTDLAWNNRAKATTDIVTRQLPFWNGVVGAGNVFGNVRGPKQASDGSGGSDSNSCFQGMVATAYVHDTDAARKSAAWSNLMSKLNTDISGGNYFCSSLGMIAAVYASGNMPDPRTLP